MNRALALRELAPKIRPDGDGIGQDESEHLAAADEAVVPAEIVVQQQVERGRFARAQRLDGALLDFRLQAATAERAVDAAVREKNRLRADLLRAGTLDAGNDPQRHAFARARGVGEGLEDDVFHAVT